MQAQDVPVFKGREHGGYMKEAANAKRDKRAPDKLKRDEKNTAERL
jgi:hypothetical protein